MNDSFRFDRFRFDRSLDPSKPRAVRLVGGLASVALALCVLPLATASAQIADDDGDLVPNVFDNCMTVANGPGEASNQVDSDLDGYGNACDADYNNDGHVTTLDYPIYIDCFTGVNPLPICDHNGDGLTTTLDFAIFLIQFQRVWPLGPSGLACAGTIPCLP